MVFSKISMIPTISAFTPGNMLKTLFLTTTFNISNALYQHVETVDGLELVDSGAAGMQLKPGTGAIDELVKFVTCHICGHPAFGGLYDSTNTQIYSATYKSDLDSDKMLQVSTHASGYLQLTHEAVANHAACQAIVQSTLEALNDDGEDTVYSRMPDDEDLNDSNEIGFNFDKYVSVTQGNEGIGFTIAAGGSPHANNLNIGKCVSYESTDLSDHPGNGVEMSVNLAANLWAAFESPKCAGHANMMNIKGGNPSKGMICDRPANVTTPGTGVSQYVNCVGLATNGGDNDTACDTRVQAQAGNDTNAAVLTALTGNAPDLAAIYAARDSDNVNRMLFMVACLNTTADNASAKCVPAFTGNGDAVNAEVRADGQPAADGNGNSPILHKYLKRYSFDMCNYSGLQDPIDFTANMGNNC